MSNKEVFNGISKVGVIGAGAAGLVAARELKREGFEVVVYEQNADVGGIWLYNPNVGDDPLGLELTGPNQGIAYQSLRTNLTRDIMGFMDYPFLVKEGRDSRRFPGHHELFLYLKDFARDFNLVELIRFNTVVEYVGMVGEGQECVMSGEEGWHMDGDPMDERVQWVPIIAEIPGTQKWPGKQLHSFNYRIPEPFSNQVVVIIGKLSSACDISLDLKMVAKEVHLSMRSTKYERYAKFHIDLHRLNVHLHPMYCDQLADRSGAAHFEEWRKEIETENIKLICSYPEMYRDLWLENYPPELMEKFKFLKI
ncbi:hypothetical protein SUGI_0214200 [Cryptomeria japonica]|nr:hypothetical protein SUGI_0214200 [Cryptomeria japonica]